MPQYLDRPTFKMLFSEPIIMKMTKLLRGIPNKRELVATAFGRLGLLGLLERIITRRRPGLIILTYHRIAKSGANLFYDPVISATPESFHTQVKWLSNRVRLLSLDELLDLVESGTPWREPAMVLTFDDAYCDNFHEAVPILRECSAPATFFIPTAFLNSPRLPWWDHTAYIIKRTHTARLTVERNANGSLPPLEIDLQTMSRNAAIMTIIRAFLDDSIADEHWFLDRLADQAKVDIDSERLGCELFMSWDQVQQLADSGAGLSIGSHAHSHCNLASLGDDAQRHGAHRLETDPRSPPRQPGQGTFLSLWLARCLYTMTKALAAQVGYRLAFSSREGINQFAEFDRYDVSRLGVGSADSAVLIRARTALHSAFGKSFL